MKGEIHKMITSKIQKRLFEMADDKYREFHSGLVPNVPSEKFIGVRVPELRKLAKELAKDPKVEEFLQQIPHQYYEENQLHSFIIDYLKEDFETCLKRTEMFLPEINNWAVCDSFKPASLKTEPKRLYEQIKIWMKSSEPYTVRLAVVLQISWFLDKWFQPDMLEELTQVAIKWSGTYDHIPEKESNQYYVLMAVAWYFSMALVKNYRVTIPYFKEKKMPKWVHNQSLQKAVESRRFSPEEKDQFRQLKIKE